MWMDRNSLNYFSHFSKDMREVLSFEVMLARAASPPHKKRRGEMILDEVLQIKVRKEFT